VAAGNLNADILTIKDIGLGGDSTNNVNKNILINAGISVPGDNVEIKKNNDPF